MSLEKYLKQKDIEKAAARKVVAAIDEMLKLDSLYGCVRKDLEIIRYTLVGDVITKAFDD